MWLNVRDSDDSSEEATIPTRNQNPIDINSDHDMFCRQNRTTENSFKEIKDKATHEQTRYLFEDLAALQKSVQRNCTSLKWSLTSQENTSVCATSEEGAPDPKKKRNPSRKFFHENISITSTAQSTSRTPFAVINVNMIDNVTEREKYAHHIHSKRRQERTKRITEMKMKNRRSSSENGH
jgi:hypothetical protein